MTEWLPCVVSNGTWTMNDSINKGDHIYRIFNKMFDIRANMRIKSIGCHMICVSLIDQGIDIPNIVFDESLRVCHTSAETDSGILVVEQTLSFNEELKPGCLYRVIDSELNFKYLMYIRCFTEGCIDVDIMKLVFNEGAKCTRIKTENYLFSSLDLKDMMFKQISLGEGCNFKLD